MRSTHHPLPETLISFVSGALPDAIGFVAACHLFMCRECAANIRRLEILGGLMLSKVPAARPEGVVVERAVARSAQSMQEESQQFPAANATIADPVLPLPLARYIGLSGSELPWETVASGVQRYAVKLPESAGQMILLRLTPGQLLLEHAHAAGMTLALVLQGVLTDRSGDYVRGDVIDWADDAPHEPRAAGDVACICLIGSEGRTGDTARRHRGVRAWAGNALPDFRLREVWDRTSALTAGAAVVFGIGIGWLLRGEAAINPLGPSNLVQIERNRLVAQGPLQSALDSLPSGGGISATSAEGRPFRLSMKMTFHSQAGEYCRQYQIAAATSERYTGIACRSGDKWSVAIQALVPPSAAASGQTIPAGSADAAVDTTIGALSEGDPLVGQEEADLIAKGWKK